jgi:hypothetical protein
MKTLLILIVAATAFAQLETPSIGTMRGTDGAWHAVYGLAGNFVLGPETAEPQAIELDDVLAKLGVAVSFTSDEVVVRRANGNEVRFAVAGVEQLRAMSVEYVQVSAGGREFVLRLKDGKEGLYLLPAAVTEVSPEVAQ